MEEPFPKAEAWVQEGLVTHQGMLPVVGGMLMDSPLLAPAEPMESHSCPGQLPVMARQVVWHPGQPGRWGWLSGAIPQFSLRAPPWDGHPCHCPWGLPVPA